jgi:hypothetical protein
MATASPTVASHQAASHAASKKAKRPATKHFITNLDGSHAPKRLGYNVFDINAGGWAVRGLPKHVQGLIYLGQKCPTAADSAFKKTVRKFAKSRKVYGYYLSDEPSKSDCPNGAAGIASRADFVRKASHGRQKSFIVLVQDYRAFRPALTHVDLVGLDPYPCSTANPHCDVPKIGQKVRAARRAHIPRSKIVPVYQAFGQGNTSDHYYNLPTAKELRAILREWTKMVPHPQMDYTYSWGNQGSSNPTLIDSPALQKVLANRFAR